VKDALVYMIDKIFSLKMLVLIWVAGFTLVFYNIVQNNNEKHEEYRAINDYCYSQGMVVVTTDAGPRCVDPRSLVRVK
jgi:hypothetical protein